MDTVQQHKDTLLAWYEAGGVTEHAAQSSKVPASTYRRRLTVARKWAKTKAGKKWAKENNINPSKSAPDIISLELQAKIKDLEAALRKSHVEAVQTEEVRQHYLGLSEYKPQAAPWKSKALDLEHGVPSLLLSDFHWMEKVNPDEIFGVNEYNHRVAIERLKKVIDKTIYLLKDKLNSSAAIPYPGIVVMLGGDMVSGTIHQELEITNEAGPMVMMVDCADHIAAGLRKLSEHFPLVYVVGVPGNHGRLNMKPMAKLNAVYNCDWGIYQLLERFLHDLVAEGKVVFNCPAARDLTFHVEGHPYRLTHGDQFRGGDGIIGPLGPITRGDVKKRTMAMTLPTDAQDYKTLVLGHFHQLHMLHSRIINGSLKGYDEYALSNNFSWEPAQQALWLTHRRYGPNHFMPVFAQDPHQPSTGSTGWIWQPTDPRKDLPIWTKAQNSI